MCRGRHTRRACGQVAREPRFRGGHTLSGGLDTSTPQGSCHAMACVPIISKESGSCQGVWCRWPGRSPFPGHPQFLEGWEQSLGTEYL